MKKSKNEPYLIFGVLFIVMGLFFVLCFVLGAIYAYKNDLWLMFVMGLFIAIIGLVLIIKTGQNNKVNNEIFVSTQNIHEYSFVDGMEGHDFEYFCADLIKYSGFYNVKVTKGSGDQGVDILAEKDGIRYAIQCKNYSSHLGNTPIQEVNAGKTFYNCHVGVVITNSYFTQGAKELAKATGVILWDRTVLEKMIKNKYAH